MLEQIYVLLTIVVAMIYGLSRLEVVFENEKINKYSVYLHSVVYGLFAVILSYFRFETELIPSFGASYILIVIGLLYKGRVVYLLSMLVYTVWLYGFPYIEAQTPLYIFVIIAIIGLLTWELLKKINIFLLGITILSITKLLSFISLYLFNGLTEITIGLYVLHMVLNIIFLFVAINEMNYLNRSIELMKYYRTRTYLDDLTGAENRRAFEETLKKAKGSMALIIIDIDHFKDINDRFGHIRGDQILLEVTEQIKGLTKGVGTLYRIGGDEFVILMPNVSRGEAIRETSRMFNALDIEIEDPSLIDPYEVTISIGLAHYPTDVSNYLELYDSADKKMYMAKDEGRDTFHY